MAFKDAKPWLSYGVMGGDMQPQGHTQVLLNMMEFGMNVQEAGEMARFRHFSDRAVGFESDIGIDVVQALIEKGHLPRISMGAYGGYQAIMSIGSKVFCLADQMCAKTAQQWATDTALG